jgi:hypothetical protein
MNFKLLLPTIIKIWCSASDSSERLLENNIRSTFATLSTAELYICFIALSATTRKILSECPTA